MLTVILYALLAILVVGVLFVVAAFLLPSGEQIAPPVPDDPPWTLPADRPLLAADVNGVRLPVAVRGYRFAETDFLLDRLAEEIRLRDAEIARLGGSLERRRAVEPAPQPEAATGTAPNVDDATSEAVDERRDWGPASAADSVEPSTEPAVEPATGDAPRGWAEPEPAADDTRS